MIEADRGDRRVTTTFLHPDLDVAGAVALLSSAGFEVDAPARIRRVVLDTFDGRLHSAGLCLQVLSGDERALELTSTGGSPPARLPWSRAVPSTGSDFPPGPFATRVVPLIAERALLPMLDVTADELVARRRDRRGKTVVAAVVRSAMDVDGVDVAGSSAVPSCLVTVEAVAGHDVDLERAVARLAKGDLDAVGAAAHEVVARALGRSLAGRESSPTVPLEAAEDALVGVRAVLANLARTIVDNLPGTLDDLDPEFLHELRVAIRRTRSVLAQSKGVVPGSVRDQHRSAFKELGAITGRTRDLDVYVMGWDDLVAPLQLDSDAATAPVLRALERHRRRAHKEMAKALAAPSTHSLLADWRDWLADPGEVEPVGPIGPFVAARITAAQKVLLEAGRAIGPDSPGEDLHDLRKDAKVLRYLLECFGGLFPNKERKAFVAQLKALQDNLGEHQDTEVQLDELRSVAHDLHEAKAVDTDALLTVGRIIDHLERRRQAARDEFAERFSAYDTKPNRAMLSALLDPVARP